MQQGEDAGGSVLGPQVEVGHPPSEQRVPLAEVVVDVETGDHPGDAAAGLVHAQLVEHGGAEGPAAVVGAGECDLGHGVLQHPGTDRMPFGVVAVQEGLG